MEPKVKKIIVGLLILLSGCSIKPKGFSVGATYLDTKIDMLGQQSEIKEVMPIVLLNFEF